MRNLSRNQFLSLALAGVGVAVGASGLDSSGAPRSSRAIGASSGGELVPLDPYRATFEAIARYPLVGLSDPHLNEQFHTFLRALVRKPELPYRINDVVVEFGNAHFQHLADRYFLELGNVCDEELAQMWRTTIGGRVY